MVFQHAHLPFVTPLQAVVLTWNVGGAFPEDDLPKKWVEDLSRGYRERGQSMPDLFVFALQEVILKLIDMVFD